MERLKKGALAPEAHMGRLTHRTAPACTYFVTTKTFGNRALFQVSEVADVVARRIVSCRDQGAYLLHEFVVMPNHLHLLLTPNDTTTLEKAMQLIKGGCSHEIHQLLNHKFQIWQPGFHDWTIRGSEDYIAKREYIQMNPVRAGIVEHPGDWLYGSAGREKVLDPMPVRFKPASGAKAPSAEKALMSELKLRPPGDGE